MRILLNVDANVVELQCVLGDEGRRVIKVDTITNIDISKGILRDGIAGDGGIG